LGNDFFYPDEKIKIQVKNDLLFQLSDAVLDSTNLEIQYTVVTPA